MAFKMTHPFKQVKRSKMVDPEQSQSIEKVDHSALKKEMAADTNRPIDTITAAQLANWVKMNK